MTKYKDKWCQEAYNKGFKEGRDFEKGQLTKAKEILHKVCYEFGIYNKDLMEEAKQFLKGESTTSNECHDCAKFDEMPKGPRCKTCDNGSHFQKKEEA